VSSTQQLSLGVLAHSRKPNERRLPIHPAHFSRIDRRVRDRIFVEHGYGAEFGATDDALSELVGGMRNREELVAECDVILLPKVQSEDLTELRGGHGRRLRATVIGFGATARGAVTALNAHGVDDVRVLTNREVAAVGSPIHSTQIVRMGHDEKTPDRTWADTPDDGVVPVARFLADNDIVVNCVLQDPDAPLIFVTEDDLQSFAPGCLIVDVSCDLGMGFSWAQPTSFAQPVIELANGARYYAVDHSPSYLWNSATWEISEALLPHIETVLAGPAAWDATPTIHRAIEIRDGVVLNPGIRSFQHRDTAYPHLVR